MKDPGVDLSPRPPLGVVAQGEAHPHAGGRDRRDPAGQGGRTGSIGSLLLGIPGPDGLQYAGRVGSGFSDSTLAKLDERADAAADRREPVRRHPRGATPRMRCGCAPRWSARWSSPSSRRTASCATRAGGAFGPTSRPTRSSARAELRRGRRARRDPRARAGTSSARRRSARRGIPAACRGSRPSARRCSAAASTTTCALKTGAPRVSCHTCTSCTSTTPGVERMCSRISSTCMPCGRRLGEHRDDLAQQRDRARDDHRRDEERRDRVGRHPAGRDDHDRGDDDDAPSR